MTILLKRLLTTASFAALSALILAPVTVFAAKVDEQALGGAVERHLSTDVPTMQWVSRFLRSLVCPSPIKWKRGG